DRLDAGRDQLLADHLADEPGPLLLRLACDRFLELGLDLAGSGEHAVGRVVDRLRVDVPRRPEHRQPRAVRRAVHAQPDVHLAAQAVADLGSCDFDVTSHGYLPAVLPALRRTVSLMYLMPLPLY